MVSSLVSLVLAASPYFFVDQHTLVRAELDGSMREVARAEVKLPGLVMGHSQRAGEDVAVVCPPDLQRTDAVSDCAVFFVDARGAARKLAVMGLSAELLPGNREVLVWTTALTLVRHSLRSGGNEVLARGVLEPRLSADGKSLGFARAPGLEALVPGFDACAFTGPLRGEAKQLGGPCRSQAPFISPDGTTLAVTTEGGLAGLVVNGRRVTGDFIPVPGRELVWLDGARALYTASYQTDVLWVFDTRSLEARALGPGREPALIDGRVLAVDGARVVRVEVGR